MHEELLWCRSTRIDLLCYPLEIIVGVKEQGSEFKIEATQQ
jgi:hypothetical protein